MKRLLVLAVVIASSGCESRVVRFDAAPCPGYGMQSTIAACTEVISSICESWERCNPEVYDADTCYELGSKYCFSVLDKEVDLDKLYTTCLPGLRNVTCEDIESNSVDQSLCADIIK